MRGTRLSPLYSLALAGCLACAWTLCAQWEALLAPPPGGGLVLRAQASADEEEADTEEQEYTSRETRTEKGTAQRIYKEGAQLKAQYHFINFNKDRVSVNFAMSAAEYRKYLAGYGYADFELNGLRAWRETARGDAWKKAYTESGKAAAERAIAEVDMEYDTRLRALLRARGLALRAGNLVECDMPVIVKRNTELLKPLALAFSKISSERGWSEENLLGGVLSMVQTAIRYKIPPTVEDGLHTGGLLPPARALLSGWGDCDTKTGLLASVLGNWKGMRMVGIAVPGHYLMAIRRLPGKGDVFVRYEGLEYVLLEPAGPAWLEPGTVGQATTALLAGGNGYKVEPFF
ncbi:MAG: hypothetical protein NDI60_11885 [Elusimicrobiales bacterium]|nr:hypothetical protein [Elusimicrobiales bacterium]